MQQNTASPPSKPAPPEAEGRRRCHGEWDTPFTSALCRGTAPPLGSEPSQRSPFSIWCLRGARLLPTPKGHWVHGEPREGGRSPEMPSVGRRPPSAPNPGPHGCRFPTRRWGLLGTTGPCVHPALRLDGHLHTGPGPVPRGGGEGGPTAGLPSWTMLGPPLPPHCRPSASQHCPQADTLTCTPHANTHTHLHSTHRQNSCMPQADTHRDLGHCRRGCHAQAHSCTHTCTSYAITQTHVQTRQSCALWIHAASCHTQTHVTCSWMRLQAHLHTTSPHHCTQTHMSSHGNAHAVSWPGQVRAAGQVQ
nr:uncharacterized protein LOC129051720 [Pongo abelii]